jgi:hypothetical protein
MVAATDLPHGRWLLREQVDQLAESHAAVLAAEAEFSQDAARVLARARDQQQAARTRAASRLPLRQRIAGRRGWPRTAGLGVTTVVTAVFLAWTSERLITHLAVAPLAVAVLPGVLITLAVAGVAAHAARAIYGRVFTVLSWVPAAIVAVTETVWIALWLAVAVGTALWIAAITGLAVTAATITVLVVCWYPAAPEPVPDPGNPAGIAIDGPSDTSPSPRVRPEPALPPRLPRHLRARCRRIRKLAHQHTHRWSEAAHFYSAAVELENPAIPVLATLMAGVDPPNLGSGCADDELPDGIEPFDALILSGLRQYHPASLSKIISSLAIAISGEGN